MKPVITLGDVVLGENSTRDMLGSPSIQAVICHLQDGGTWNEMTPGKTRCCFLVGTDWERFAEGAAHEAPHQQPQGKDGQGWP